MGSFPACSPVVDVSVLCRVDSKIVIYCNS